MAVTRQGRRRRRHAARPSPGTRNPSSEALGFLVAGWSDQEKLLGDAIVRNLQRWETDAVSLYALGITTAAHGNSPGTLSLLASLQFAKAKRSANKQNSRSWSPNPLKFCAHQLQIKSCAYPTPMGDTCTGTTSDGRLVERASPPRRLARSARLERIPRITQDTVARWTRGWTHVTMPPPSPFSLHGAPLLLAVP